MDRNIIVTLIVAVVGVLLVITGVSMHYITNWQVKSQLADNLQLKEGSASFESWLSPPVPVYMQFWMWNVTNPDKVITGVEKPNLVQMGPYTYREVRNKTAVEFQEGGKYIRFKERKWFVFEREMSSGSDQDHFVGVNLPMLGLSVILKQKLSLFQQHMAGSALGLAGVKLFTNHTVDEYLWGYEDPFFKNVKKIMTKFGYNDSAQQIPDIVGLFTGPKGNGTDGGWWTVNTGQDDINSINEIHSWNGLKKVDYWNADYANMINGTGGSGWHPFIERHEKLPIFSSDICRSVDMVHQRDIDIKGLNLYRYIVDPLALADNETNPENSAYCTPAGNCMGGGVLNISACTGGPIILSLPHFNGADQSFRNAVNGMEPTEDMETFLDIHPMMGTVLHAERRMQFNAYIEPNPVFSDTLDMNPTVFPILWVNETAVVGDDTAKLLITKLHRPIFLVNIASYASAIVGLVLVFVIACFTLFKFIRAQMGDHKKKKCGSGISIIHNGEGEMLRENSAASQLSAQSQSSGHPLLAKC